MPIVEMDHPDTKESLEIEFPDDMPEDEILWHVKNMRSDKQGDNYNYFTNRAFENVLQDINSQGIEEEGTDVEYYDDSMDRLGERIVDREQFSQFMSPFLKAEGGSKFTNDPDDSGGATKYGIKLDTLKEWRGDNAVTEEDVKALDEEEAIDIYQNRFYFGPKINELGDRRVQEIVMDHGINAGPTVGIRMLQRVVGAPVDGRIGPKTASAVDKYIEQNGVERLLENYSEARKRFYNTLADRRPKDKKFLKGWINRVDDTLGRLLNQNT